MTSYHDSEKQVYNEVQTTPLTRIHGRASWRSKEKLVKECRPHGIKQKSVISGQDHTAYLPSCAIRDGQPTIACVRCTHPTSQHPSTCRRRLRSGNQDSHRRQQSSQEGLGSGSRIPSRDWGQLMQRPRLRILSSARAQNLQIHQRPPPRVHRAP